MLGSRCKKTIKEATYMFSKTQGSWHYSRFNWIFILLHFGKNKCNDKKQLAHGRKKRPNLFTVCHQRSSWWSFDTILFLRSQWRRHTCTAQQTRQTPLKNENCHHLFNLVPNQYNLSSVEHERRQKGSKITTKKNPAP